MLESINFLAANLGDLLGVKIVAEVEETGGER